MLDTYCVLILYVGNKSQWISGLIWFGAASQWLAITRTYVAYSMDCKSKTVHFRVLIYRFEWKSKHRIGVVWRVGGFCSRQYWLCFVWIFNILNDIILVLRIIMDSLESISNVDSVLWCKCISLNYDFSTIMLYLYSI